MAALVRCTGREGTMRIIIGSDHRGKEIFNLVTEYIRENTEHSLTRLSSGDSVATDYPDIGIRVAEDVGAGKFDCGILICGTGIGMCVVANKFPGVRAAPCNNEVMAELARKHNDSNVLCLAGDLLGEYSSLQIVEKWLNTEFCGEHHCRRLAKIRAVEAQNYKLPMTTSFESASEQTLETSETPLPLGHLA